jgi:two-component system OmpR family response regulator
MPDALRAGTALVVEDEDSIASLVRSYLERDGFTIVRARNGEEALAELERNPIRVVVLDIGLPDIDGFDVCSRIREHSRVPVVMLTARDEEPDRINGLELGADDYVTKPFSPRELLARIRALLRRSRAQETVADGLARIRAYRFADWELSVRLRRLKSRGGETFALTNSEFNLLAAFLAAPQRVLSREQLLELSRMHNDEVYDRSIDVQVGRLRRKLKSNGTPAQYIRTERGAGYVFTVGVETVR